MITPATETGRTLLDNATTVIATSAVSSPFWLPWLHTASQVGAAIAPILGAVWLLVQIWAKISEVRHRNRKDAE